MSENSVETDNGYQILVVNLTYDREKLRNKSKDIPDPLILTVKDEKILGLDHFSQDFNDAVETFVYDLVHSKYGTELYRCQIYLPLENKTK